MSDDLDGIVDPLPVEETVETPEAVEPEATTQEPEPSPEAEPEPAPPTQTEAEKGLLSVVTALWQEVRSLKSQQPQAAPPPIPDVIEDQQGFTQTIEQRVQSQILNERQNLSEAIARRDYGDEKVNAAFEAMQASNDPTLHQKIATAPMPYDALVKWHDQQQFSQEVGNDPAAFKARLEAEIRAKVEAEMAAKQTAAQVAQAAPSLANQPNIGGRNAPASPTLTPLDDLLG